ncbi:MAG TPA: NAD-dependent DNA ligase LigA [Candidatus Acetatifactor stercoripullorum]|uniref:DNA ligase n=1 Tax=Candidatus Acetatifactor stercoripullorum TaxID=2838414 RepID=A0A9D1R6L6_9FIRM|nr:NAD-dependent DNA ligase LigA [uncultured Acetatifactor sp.]HIW81458.1 NAD-dependent DNA ligase LigA [Candidatus Acetatifactor stercoripullorum]
MQTSKVERIKYLVETLNKASKAYYAQDREIMSNFEYDKLYDELTALEEETGVVLANSPTVNVGYEAVEALPKERHETPMLSLGKTKSREELRDWLEGNPAILSWKLDGLTVVLTYREGKLAKAVTRGNGEIGEVVTNNARTFKNLPLHISFQGELILRGEAVISYSDFEKMNSEIEDADARYKNPRNLCSGSVRQLNNEITAKRNVQFYAFTLVKAQGEDFHNSKEAQFAFLQEQGFDVVEHCLVTEETILQTIEEFERKVETYDIPSDGLVLTYEDIAYGQSLGSTAKFPRDSIAFKWADELRETSLIEIQWSPSRTGLINPVAVFEPVELEGTTVSRASVHNISILKGLKLGIGDRITVYKANMIIPQIAENLTCSDTVEIPKTCPVCGGRTQIRQINEVQSLYCTNEKCAAKRIKAFTLFVSRDAMNIDGMSEATLEKFIDRGFIREYADLFHLDRHREEITQMEGFGEKSCQNLLDSIEKARNTTLPRVIYGLGIANIGVANAKMLCRHFDYQLERMQNADVETLSTIEGVGEVIASAFVDYMRDGDNLQKIENLLKELRIEKPETSGERTLENMSFVVTGSLQHFESRNQLKELIEERGGKVAGSVTGKTVCLINNDISSASSKNKKAKELGIPIITEEEFMEKYLQES